MDFKSILIYVYFTPVPRSLSLSVCCSRNARPPLPPPDYPSHPTTPKVEHQKARAHATTQPHKHPKTMAIVSAEDDQNSAWAFDSTAFRRKILAKMGWKEEDGILKYRQDMKTNLRAYPSSNHLGVSTTIDLHGDSGWSKTNKNFGGILLALMREHQWGTTGMGGTDGPPAAATVTGNFTMMDQILIRGGGRIGDVERRRLLGGRGQRLGGRRGRGSALEAAV